MLFILALDATADAGNEYPLGSRQKLVVIVRADADDEAIAEAQIALTNKQWRDGALKEIVPFAGTPSSIDDPVIREAAMRAAQGHRSIIVTEQS